MGLVIPNYANATYPPQSEVDAGDIQIISDAFNRTATVSGAGVTAQGSPNMTVAVAAGSVEIAGVTVAVTGGNVTITANSSGNPRFDLISVNTSGTKSATAGTAAAAPVYPTIPANSAVLAAVYVPNGVSAITTAMIYAKSPTLALITASNVATANKDGTAATASMRTLGVTATTAAPGDLDMTTTGDIVYNSSLGRVRKGIGLEGQTLRAAPESVANNPIVWGGGWADPMIEQSRPTAALAETVPRAFIGIAVGTATLATGSLRLVAIYLKKSQVVASITFWSGSTAGASMTHTIFGLYSSALSRLATSADDTTATWTANTSRTLTMSASYTVTATGLYYVGIMVVGTVPTLTILSQSTNLTAASPKLHINSSTGQTTTIPATAADNGGAAHIPYAYVS